MASSRYPAARCSPPATSAPAPSTALAMPAVRSAQRAAAPACLQWLPPAAPHLPTPPCSRPCSRHCTTIRFMTHADIVHLDGSQLSHMRHGLCDVELPQHRLHLVAAMSASCMSASTSAAAAAASPPASTKAALPARAAASRLRAPSRPELLTSSLGAAAARADSAPFPACCAAAVAAVGC